MPGFAEVVVGRDGFVTDCYRRQLCTRSQGVVVCYDMLVTRCATILLRAFNC